MLLLIDNYDSFTYNLYQLLAAKTDKIKVYRNDKISLDEIEELKPSHIVISPGPGTPYDAGICIDLIKRFSPKIPILGVCLGMQAMAEAFKGKVVRAGICVHGKPCFIFHRREGIFQNMPLPFSAGRYHSLIIEKESLPTNFSIEAESPDGLIMAIKHKEYPLWGVQFHPESILTPEGAVIVQNFLALTQ